MNKFSFLTLNLIMGTNILKYPMIIMIYLLWVIGDEINLQVSLTIWFAIIGICSGIIYISFWLLKILIFIILYKESKKDRYTYNFFEKFKNNEEFQDNILLKSLLFDIFFFVLEAVIIYLMKNPLEPIKEIPNCLFLTLILWLITGTGTLLSYFSLSFWLGKENKKSVLDSK